MNIFRNYYKKNPELETFMRVIESHLNTMYIWGGDDPQGFDCSGLVIEGLKSIGFVEEKFDNTADGLFNFYKEYEVQKPVRGSLVFYFDKSEHCYHIAVCLDETYCVTADGGRSTTNTIQDAKDHNAFVKIRRIDKRNVQRKYVHLFKLK